MLEGVKQISAFISGQLGRSFSNSSVSRYADPAQDDPLPVTYDRAGRMIAEEGKVLAWATRPGRRQVRQRREPSQPAVAPRSSSSRRKRMTAR